MPRLYGNLSSKAAALVRNRDEFRQALLTDNRKVLSSLHHGSDDEDFAAEMRLIEFASLFPGVRTNRFVGFNDYLIAGTKKVWAATRAADIVANVIISTDMRMIWRDPDKNRAGAKIKKDADLTRLLQNPNPHETISELLYLWTMHMMFTGNVFWYKDAMNGRGQPANIFWLNPKNVQIIPDRNLHVSHYIYNVNGEEIRFEADEIIHFRRPNANGSLFGLGEVESGESLYDDFINRTLFNARFMANGAMPSAVLAREDADNMDQADWKKQKDSFQENYGGVRNSGKVAWLSGKWTLHQLGIDARKMQELEKSGQTIEHIFINHGVPLSVAGFGSANFATADVEDRNFRRYTVLPKLNVLTDTMNSPRGFIEAFNPEIRLDFPLSGLIDVEKVVKENKDLFDRGAITPNDFRELCGYQRKAEPLLDQHFMSKNYVPIEIAGVATPTDEDLDNAGKPESGRNTSDGEASGTRKAA